jgi:hypothetical protein
MMPHWRIITFSEKTLFWGPKSTHKPPGFVKLHEMGKKDTLKIVFFHAQGSRITEIF